MKPALLVAAAAALGLVACGGGGETTTVIREVPTETVERQQPSEAEPAADAEAEAPEPRGKVPNVLGLPLPEAQRMLREAGYRTAAKNTDTTFGIVVPDNYTICRQGKPRGDVVVVLAQKYGC